jgi:phosphocarrier protein HPr
MRITEKLVVLNSLGLNMVAAAELVKISSHYQSFVTLRNQARTADSRSILGLLALGAAQGAELELTFDGKDADEVRRAFNDFFASGFSKPTLKTPRFH